MNARMLDVVTGITSLGVFVVALIALSALFPAERGLAYVIAIAVYIALMSGTGILIREKIA